MVEREFLVRSLSGLLAVLVILAPATLRAQVDRSVDIATEQPLSHFIPDVLRLERLSGDDIQALYADMTVRGIYRVLWGDDRRYTEFHSKDGRADYKKGAYESVADWFVVGDEHCFEYDDSPGQVHCAQRYRYGDCIVSYSRGVFPNPANWNAVQQIVDADYKWPSDPSDEAGIFNCDPAIS